LISTELINRSIEAAIKFGACISAVQVKDTIKRVDQDTVIETVPRDHLWQVQTPQSFRYSILLESHEKAKTSDFYSTDESALVEWAGFPVKIIRGDYTNIKITTREDYELAKILFEEENKK
jgi:2-C-methyl-D-erythritol 4-phosphate cytidylyltransferase